jgi:hypothetical protein
MRAQALVSYSWENTVSLLAPMGFFFLLVLLTHFRLRDLSNGSWVWIGVLHGSQFALFTWTMTSIVYVSRAVWVTGFMSDAKIDAPDSLE